MSCYQWERGSVLIPSAEWAGLKRRVRTAYNKRQEKLYDAAVKVWKRLKKEGKGERHSVKSNLWRIAHKTRIKNQWARYGYRTRSLVDSEIRTIQKSILRSRSDRSKVYKPRKKDFPKKTNRDTSFSYGDAGFRFDNDSRTLHWTVMENNRAVERAHDHPLTRALLRSLGQVEWTRNSGGVFYGNDEYHRESGGPGGGANYVTHRFGPRGKKVAA